MQIRLPAANNAAKAEKKNAWMNVFSQQQQQRTVYAGKKQSTVTI